MNSSEYQVTIKSANQKVDDYVTKCNPTWTVLRLKQHISETHINNPRVEDQRLIYAGNVLKDSHILKQIFFRDSLCTELTNSNKTEFTIHLVCNTLPSKTSSSSSTTGQATSSNGQQNNNTSPSARSASSLSTSATTTPNVVNLTRPLANPTITRSNHQNHQASIDRNTPIVSPNNNLNQSGPTPVQQNTFTSAQQAEAIRNFMQSDQMRQQMAVFQQLAYVVAAQIANSVANTRNSTVNTNDQASQAPIMLSAFDGQTLNVQLTTPSSSNHINAAASQMLYAGNRQQTQFVQTDTHTAAAGVHQNENINNENNANAPGPAGEPVGAQFNFRAQMQAQAPVVEQAVPQPDHEGPMIQHDVIDWVYYSVRAIVLVTALYIHATMFRLLLIVGALAIAYLFNRRRPQRQEQQPQPAQMDNQAQMFRLAEQDQAELRRRNVSLDELHQPDEVNGRNGTDGATQGRVQEEPVQGRIPFLKLCYLVVTEFLASLVPE